jgi:hypothetical protein
VLHPRQVITINPNYRRSRRNGTSTIQSTNRKVRPQGKVNANECQGQKGENGRVQGEDDDEIGDEEEVIPEEGNEQDYDVIVVDMDPLVDELVEIRALLERLVYHVEERWNVNEQKAKSP